MSGDWPADPSDPRCPECDGPVSATAGYCLHCYADLPADDAPGATPPGDAPAVQPPAAEGIDLPSPDTTVGQGPGDSDHRRTAPGRRRGPTGPREAAGVAADRDSRWLHPDGLLDDASTLLVGLVGGALDGFLLLLLAVWALPRPVQSSWGLPLVGAGWLLATGYVAHSRTVFGAARKAATSLAALLALVPLVLSFALRDPAPFLFGLVLWPLALAVLAVGQFFGRGAVDDG